MRTPEYKKLKDQNEQAENINMLEERPIDEFRQTGLLLLTNQFLHIFGWALTVEIDDFGNSIRIYPAYCKFRGFNSDDVSKAYEQVTRHIEKRIPELLKDLEIK